MTRTYSAEEVAERLDRHTESIRRNLRSGQLEGEKWSNEWVITDEALKDWLPEAIYQKAFSAKTDADA